MTIYLITLKKKYNISNLENKDQVNFFKKKKIKEWKIRHCLFRLYF